MSGVCTIAESIDSFISHIEREQLFHKDARNRFATQKITFVTALLALGSVNQFSSILKDKIDFTWLLYIAPIVATGYDALIYSENVKVKRIGTFLRKNCVGIRHAWENWVAEHRENWAFTWGSFIFTILTFLPGAYSFILKNLPSELVASFSSRGMILSLFLLWVIILLAIIFKIFFSEKRLAARLEED